MMKPKIIFQNKQHFEIYYKLGHFIRSLFYLGL
jgi:hypothetical protein